MTGTCYYCNCWCSGGGSRSKLVVDCGGDEISSRSDLAK